MNLTSTAYRGKEETMRTNKTDDIYLRLHFELTDRKFSIFSTGSPWAAKYFEARHPDFKGKEECIYVQLIKKDGDINDHLAILIKGKVDLIDTASRNEIMRKYMEYFCINVTGEALMEIFPGRVVQRDMKEIVSVLIGAYALMVTSRQ